MSFELDNTLWNLFPVVSTAALGSFICLSFTTKQSVGIILVTAFYGIFSYLTFLARTVNDHSFWRFLSMPVIYSLMVLDGLVSGQQQIWTKYFWSTFLLNILGGAIATVILRYRFSKPPIKNVSPDM
jgi:hypothetical protein